LSIDGKFCPEIEFAPQTPEGLFVAALLDRPGIWRRAGMSGSIAGMDIAEARATLPAELANEFAIRLLVAAERNFVIAYCATKNETD
jgi:hypothetical protein